MSDLSPRQLLQGLSLVRIALGAVTWIAPGVLTRAYGASIRDHPPVPVMARTFAAREVAIGVGAMTADTAGERRRWLDLGIAIDATDALALAAAGIRRQIPRPIAALGALGALGAVAVAVSLRNADVD